MKKLRKKEPRVKYKALLVLKNCIERGHVSFRRELVLRAEEVEGLFLFFSFFLLSDWAHQVRAELGFSGPPDPMEGDAPYRRVREEADKVLNMMYDETARKEDPTKKKQQQSMEGGQDSQPEPPPQWNNTPSMLPTQSNKSYSYDPATGGKKYEGMGNWTPPAENTSYLGKAASIVGSVGSAVVDKANALVGRQTPKQPDWNDKEIYTRGGNTGSYTAPGTGVVQGTGIHGLSQQQANLFEKKKKKHRRKPGEVAGGWNQDDDDGDEEDEQGTPSTPPPAKFDYAKANESLKQLDNAPETAAPSSSADGGSGGAAAGGAGSSEEDVEDQATYEWRVVDELCRASGLRTHPTADELTQFIGKVRSLDVGRICRSLDAKVQDDHWQVRLKALCAIEKVVEAKIKGARRHFAKHSDPLVAETQSANKAVRAKATTVCELVFKGKSIPAARSAPRPVEEVARTATTTAPLHSQVSSPVAPSVQVGGGGASMLDFGTAPTPTPAVAPTGGIGGLESLLSSPTTHTVAAAPVIAPTASPQPAGGLSGLQGVNLSAPAMQPGMTTMPTPYYPAPMGVYAQPGVVAYQQPMYTMQYTTQPTMMGATYAPYGTPQAAGTVGMVKPAGQPNYAFTTSPAPVGATPSAQTKPSSSNNDSFSFVADAMKKGVK